MTSSTRVRSSKFYLSNFSTPQPFTIFRRFFQLVRANSCALLKVNTYKGISKVQLLRHALLSVNVCANVNIFQCSLVTAKCSLAHTIIRPVATDPLEVISRFYLVTRFYSGTIDCDVAIDDPI